MPLQGASLQARPRLAQGPLWVRSQARQGVHRSLQTALLVQMRGSPSLLQRPGKGQMMLRRFARGVSVTFTPVGEAGGCVEPASRESSLHLDIDLMREILCAMYT